MAVLQLRLDDLEWRELDGEIVALDLKSSAYFTVNDSGAFLWQVLVEGATAAHLVDRLFAEFDVTRAQAESDVGAFLARLRTEGLLVEAS